MRREVHNFLAVCRRILPSRRHRNLTASIKQIQWFPYRMIGEAKFCLSLDVRFRCANEKVRFELSFLPLTVLRGFMFCGSPLIALAVFSGIQIVVVVFFTCTQKSEFEQRKLGPDVSQ